MVFALFCRVDVVAVAWLLLSCICKGSAKAPVPYT